ncbi:hypothetical protein LR48_Vigan04g153600 [Vigna angularis]|uniref:Uncharacterized protein n=1 Tax=Phaseolus angularis TaxID=3914 RepID=A0A0L9UF18_PHAAN|nr:hypothetical protein LR48_Vigan04g153600 [Vigna angularis]
MSQRAKSNTVFSSQGGCCTSILHHQSSKIQHRVCHFFCFRASFFSRESPCFTFLPANPHPRLRLELEFPPRDRDAHSPIEGLFFPSQLDAPRCAYGMPSFLSKPLGVLGDLEICCDIVRREEEDRYVWRNLVTALPCAVSLPPQIEMRWYSVLSADRTTVCAFRRSFAFRRSKCGSICTFPHFQLRTSLTATSTAFKLSGERTNRTGARSEHPSTQAHAYDSKQNKVDAMVLT